VFDISKKKSKEFVGKINFHTFANPKIRGMLETKFFR